jgi:hypothetical protein
MGGRKHQQVQAAAYSNGVQVVTLARAQVSSGTEEEK